MSDGWDKVIEIYTRNPVAHCAKITNSGDTALHIAVIGGKKKTVEQLVSLMSLEEAAKALRVKNERGYTPLHLAAFVGNASLCDCLASKIYSDEELRNSSGNEQVEKIEAGYDILGERNKENETPLFLAAVMGKTDAFLCLHGFVLPRYRDSYYRGNKGDTILHVAISGEYFGENIRILTKIKAYMFSIRIKSLFILSQITMKRVALIFLKFLLLSLNFFFSQLNYFKSKLASIASCFFFEGMLN